MERAALFRGTCILVLLFGPDVAAGARQQIPTRSLKSEASAVSSSDTAIPSLEKPLYTAVEDGIGGPLPAGRALGNESVEIALPLDPGHPLRIRTLSPEYIYRQGRSWGHGDTTGGVVWMGGAVVATYLASSAGKALVGPGKMVIELGSGTGVVGVAAARMGASRVVSTDGSPTMVALTALNANLNLPSSVAQSFSSTQWLWGSTPPVVKGSKMANFDTVLMGDLIYSGRYLEAIEADGTNELLEAILAVC